MDKINDILERSDASIAGNSIAALDSMDSDTTMDNDTTENTSDSIVQDVDTTTMADESDSTTTMANSITDNDATDDLSDSTDDSADMAIHISNPMDNTSDLITNTPTLISTTIHSISITCCPSPSSSSSSSSDSTTGSTTSTPPCILKPTHFSSTSPLIRRNLNTFPRPEWAGVRLARQKSDQEQRVFAKKQCVRFCGDEEGEEEDEAEGDIEEDNFEEEGKGEGKNWGLEPQRRNQDRREGGTFMESFWRVGDEEVEWSLRRERLEVKSASVDVRRG
ncbi:hypothetical protein D6D01_07306 [Aureobasidium pullulans]|uniref:Uncharacterized protein n=1 Tax=Aureobasidium pullulans TaxID=5580 RepID=A0A4S9KPW4_AURPU|nr:hypothetical protein D6D01_07306 [Aureobasidium pullulans]